MSITTTYTYKVVYTTSSILKDQFACILTNIENLTSITSSTPINEVVLDFAGYRYAPPLLSAFFCTLLDRCHSAVNINGNGYLQAIKFPIGLSCENGTCNMELQYYIHKSFLPLVRLNLTSTASPADRNALISSIGHLIRTQAKVPANVYGAIMYKISELTDNAIEHSNASQCWISAQYYKSTNYLDLCIAESGRGLLNSYKEYRGEKDYSYIDTHSQAIKGALEGCSTKHLTERGFGLHTSINLVENGLKGSFILLSGDSFYSNHNIASFNGVYNGTLAFFRIPCIKDENFSLIKYVDK